MDRLWPWGRVSHDLVNPECTLTAESLPARAHTGGAFGHGSSEPGEQSAAHGRTLIRQQSSALHLSEHIAEKAQRYYNLAISHRFIKGRKSEYVAAVCLYIACRTSGTRHMLIDFSDMLRVGAQMWV